MQGTETAKEASEPGRSVKSEYDYGSKRKFVDVLGNSRKTDLIMTELNKKKQDQTTPSLKSASVVANRIAKDKLD